MLLEKIEKELTRDITQRGIYGLGLVLWIFLLWDRLIHFPYDASSLGLSYATLFIVPAVLLFLQIIRNNKLIWGVIFSLVSTYIGIALYLVISDAIERRGSRVKAIDWGLENILLLVFGFAALFIADWIVYKMRPKRMI